MFARPTPLVPLLGTVLALGASSAFAQQPLDSSFTYQGRLTDNGAAPTGVYDFRFTLWDDPIAGNQIGPSSVYLADDLQVTSGLFTAKINLDPLYAFGPNKRWLKIEVRQGASVGAYTALSPRQEITPAPVAQHAMGPWVSAPSSGIWYSTGFGVSIGDTPTGFDKLRVNAEQSFEYGIHAINRKGVDDGFGFGIGVWGEARGPSGIGLNGTATAYPGGVGVKGSGSNAGGYFTDDGNDPNGFGAYCRSNFGTGLIAVGGNAGTGVRGVSVSNDGARGESDSGRGVAGTSTSNVGVAGISVSNTGVSGHSSNGFGVSGTSDGSIGVYGNSADSIGVLGSSTTGTGVSGSSGSGRGISGSSDTGVGVNGVSNGNDGVLGQSSASGHAGVSGVNSNSDGLGGYFENSAGGIALNVNASGSCGFLCVQPAVKITVPTAGNLSQLISGVGGGTQVFSVLGSGSLTIAGSASKPGGGSWSNSSDARLKKNIRTLDGSLGRLLSLHGTSFEYIDPASINELSGERMGFIAQEVEKVLPDWVSTDDRGFKRITIRGFEALAVEAIRDLRAEKDAQIAELKADNAALRERLDAQSAGFARRLAQLEERTSPTPAEPR